MKLAATLGEVEIQAVAAAPAAGQMLGGNGPQFNANYSSSTAVSYQKMHDEDASLREIEEAFDLMDTDGTKQIDRNEFKKGISKLQLHKPKGAADGWKDDAFDRFDVSNTGHIDYNEFCFAIATLVMSAKARKEAKSALQCFQEAIGELEATQSAAKAQVDIQAGSINDEENEAAIREAAAEAVVEVEKNEAEECHNGWGILVGLAVFPCALACLSIAKSTSGPRLTGMPAVVKYVTDGKEANADYYWSIQCYHYETRTHTVGSGKRRRRVTRRVRVNTHFASTRGGLVCNDDTDTFVPNTRLRNTALTSKLAVEIGGGFAGRYSNRKNMFYNANRRDRHQDTHESFHLPSMHDTLRAEWVGGGEDPCYASRGMCCVSVLTCTAACWFAAMRNFIGAQEYTFEKTATAFTE